MTNILVNPQESENWGDIHPVFEGYVNAIPVTANTHPIGVPCTAIEPGGACPDQVPPCINGLLRIAPNQTFGVSKAGVNRENDARLTGFGYCKLSTTSSNLLYCKAESGKAFNAPPRNSNGWDLDVTPDPSQVSVGDVYLYLVQWQDGGGTYYLSQITTHLIQIVEEPSESPGVCVYTGSPGLAPDPSLTSDQGYVTAISVTPETVDVREEQVLCFSLAQDDLSFTGFRYMNTAENAGVWYQPKNGTTPYVPIASNPEFEYVGHVPTRTDTQKQKTMTIKDRASNDVIYLYLVEWKDDKTTPSRFSVCDPKIKNEPPPEDPPPKTPCIASEGGARHD